MGDTESIKEFERFVKRLYLRNLSEETIDQYARYYGLIEKAAETEEMNQDLIDAFLYLHTSNLVRSFLRQYIAFKKIKHIEIPRYTGRTAKKKVEVISKKELDLIINTAYQKSSQIGLIIELSIKCALRRNEARHIKPADFRWEEWLSDTSQDGVLLIKKGKGKKERYVVVPTELMKKLMDFVLKEDVQDDQYVFFKESENKDQPIDKMIYWRAFHKVCKEAVNKHYKIHSLRHSTATHWYEDGIDIIRIKSRLGHASIATTQLYINPDETEEIQKWKEGR